MFDISTVKKTKKAKAPKIVLAGPGKIGKTTFAASAPQAVGILTEDGAHHVDANAFPVCSTLAEVYECVSTLLNEKHEFKTVFLDSLDWLEPMLHQKVCKENNWDSIESPGYGKGYVAALEEWRVLLSGFDALRDQRGMTVILIAHDKIRHIENPMNEGYDAYSLKLHDKASALVVEWADIVGFANHKVLTKTSDAGFGQKETKAVSTGERVLYLEPHAAHCAGNRLGLKNTTLSWAALADQLTKLTKE